MLRVSDIRLSIGAIEPPTFCIRRVFHDQYLPGKTPSGCSRLYSAHQPWHPCPPSPFRRRRLSHHQRSSSPHRDGHSRKGSWSAKRRFSCFVDCSSNMSCLRMQSGRGSAAQKEPRCVHHATRIWTLADYVDQLAQKAVLSTTNVPPPSSSELLEKTGYDMATHASESADWINVLFAEVSLARPRVGGSPYVRHLPGTGPSRVP